MRRIAKCDLSAVELRDESSALETRLLRSMIASVAVAVAICATMAPWRITSGLVLGGALSVLNYRWLHTSVAAIFKIDFVSETARAGVSRYVLRYFVVGVVAFAAVNLQFVSLAATLIGLCAFVPALFVEAAREFYFAIIHREESV